VGYHFEVFKSKYSSDWYWRLRANNGRIVADSAEGYVSEWNCREAIKRVRERLGIAPWVRVKVRVEK
jgi:uncharacterized protein YegP (UPF0339 family)